MLNKSFLLLNLTIAVVVLGGCIITPWENSFEGRVRDIDSNATIAGATVQVYKKPKTQTVSDCNGFFKTKSPWALGVVFIGDPFSFDFTACHPNYGCQNVEVLNFSRGPDFPKFTVYLRKDPNAVAIVKKYSSPPVQAPWHLVDDTDEFWHDVNSLYCASLHGDPNAIHTVFVIDSFTDGAIAEQMPDLELVMKKNPNIVRKVILNDASLKKKYSHLLP
jgi:hypothetical protein